MASSYGSTNATTLKDDVLISVQERLLADAGAPLATASIPDINKKISYWSLPHKRQLAFLCLARFADPLAATSISSYMFFQLKWFDPSQSNATITTQVGILIGAKTAAQVCTGMLWGRLADSELGGRKTVLTIGLLSEAISMLRFGCSTTLRSAVAWQIMNGSMNASVSMVRCMVAELNPEKRYRARALTLLPLCANAGTLLGPLVGGLLVSNNLRTPESSNATKYPYLYPNLVISIIFAIAAIGIIFGVEETLETLQDGNHSFTKCIYYKVMSKLTGKDTSEYNSTNTSNTEEQNVRPMIPTCESTSTSIATSNSTTPLLRTKSLSKKKRTLPFYRMWTFNVICTMLSHFIISGHIGTFSSMWAIFLSTPIATPSSQHPPIHFTGGLGMTPRLVGLTMSLLGAIGVVLQALVYPTLNDRFGTVQVWRAAMYIFPIVYLVAPFPALIASSSSSSSLQPSTREAATWTAMLSIMFLYVMGRTGITPATALLINDCTPHPSVRATIHTTGTMVSNLSRSIFPVTIFAMFGYGQRIGVVGLGFWCVMLLALLACVASRWVTEGTNGKEIILDGDDDDDAVEEGEHVVIVTKQQSQKQQSMEQQQQQQERQGKYV